MKVQAIIIIKGTIIVMVDIRTTMMMTRIKKDTKATVIKRVHTQTESLAKKTMS